MLLSVFSFTPQNGSTSSEVSGRASTQGSAQGERGSVGQEFAELMRANADENAELDGSGPAKVSKDDAELNALIAEFSTHLHADTALDTEALATMAASIDAVLAQTSAASYTPALTDALETIRAALNDLKEGLEANTAKSTLSFKQVIASVVQYASAPDADTSSDTDIAILAMDEGRKSPMQKNLFGELQSNLSDNDITYNAELNALLALYQAPGTYYAATVGQPMSVSSHAQHMPHWVAQAQSVNAYGLTESPLPHVALPTMEMPKPGEAVDHATARAELAVASRLERSVSGDSLQTDVGMLVSDAAKGHPQSEMDAAEYITRGNFAEAMAEKSDHNISPVRGALETLAPLTQLTHNMQTDGVANVGATMHTPVVEVVGATGASYTANGTTYVPRGVVADQVQIALKHATAEGLGRITIQLDPQDLGRIDVRMDTGRDGVTHLAFTVDRPETLDMLQRDARTLERVLQNSGLQTDAGNMEFHLRQQPGQQQAGEQSGQPQGQQASSDISADTEAEQRANAQAELGAMASLGADASLTHQVHYGVNMQV